MQRSRPLARFNSVLHKTVGANIKAHGRCFSITPGANSKSQTTAFDEETDVLIIGSGAGALTASLRATKLGLRNIVVEKQKTLGGASVISGGGLWIPCNPVSKAAGINDSEQSALQYFEQAVGDVGPASSLERRQAYIENGPKMISFLQEEGFRFHFTRDYPDYYPAVKGAMGKGGGRTIESKTFDIKKLGDWQGKLPPPSIPVAIYTNDAAAVSRLASSASAFIYIVQRIVPLIAQSLIGRDLVSMGRGLIAQLLYLGRKGKMDVRLNTGLTKLIQGPTGDVVGAELRTSAGPRTIRAGLGVVLAAGGFAHNHEMRKRFLPAPASTSWTSSPQGDTGDAIKEGMRLGAATALMDDAWWGPTIIDPVTSKVSFALMERSRPHCFIVDSTGSRFMNEAQSYTDAGHDQYERNSVVKAIPAWLIMDTNHRNKYMLGHLFARVKPPKEAIAEKRIFVANSLRELASQIEVDPKALQHTAQKYNAMCQEGVDSEFCKGNSAYDQFFGDPAVSPNPNMGSVDRPPYYAIQIWPGDLGTKGGLLTDEFQRVLGKDMRPIPGLLAIGNTAASIMGRTYLGAGSTLGPAMTHGYIAANFLSSRVSR